MVNATLVSMTGFAALGGRGEGCDWAWEIRSVNGRGLDLRLRIPDWIEGLEAAIRAAVAGAVQRGNVTVSLRLGREPGAEAGRIDAAALDAVLDALSLIRGRAEAIGLPLAAPSAAEILTLRGVAAAAGSGDEDTAPLRAALMADFARLLESFRAMRAAEGRALAALIAGQLEAIEALLAEARRIAAERREEMADNLRANLARVMAGAAEADPDRVAQELALMVVKADVTEEIDRLEAHLGAARALLGEEGPVGRKFDFLVQEFMREANTLCAKSGHAGLTRIGLDLKTVIDQMREQVQNVE
ncbi:YicC/YloC family endoribonuclease [Albidovulum sp.]